ncbi:trypsin-like peptidase domain-containing protein [Streptomyces sp. BPTC-684]|uniref:VMAP-C domain-containing protein n=1 Tax=Streptomyces sp. BPTC-684 TaxID=3043734 RepID=UPI0024B0F005|nr:trypsin-like peptidase domain-containing protein [Streptomyces sp. BPTC-684]WHM35726.1 trypsin-like peptidase domain-containing protein [Streptomyces sp. BPTC-684]
MGWFKAPGADPSADARGALVRVLSADRGRTAGAGVYLAGRRLLTCAHVVNAALGLRMLSPRDPGAVTLDVSFPALSPGTSGARQARLVAWVPPRAADHQGPVADGSLEWGGDLAVLELDEEPPPPVGPVRWLDMRAGQLVRAWYGGGQPFSYADVQVGSCDGRIGYLDGQLSGAAVDDGYSGGPLWSPADGAAVGLVMGRITAPDGEFDTQHTVRRSWGLSWQSVRQELLRVGAAPDPAPPGAREPAGGDESVRDMMVGPLHTLLGDPTVRAAHSTALGAALGLRTRADGTAPSVEELAVLLCTVERALPTLAESLAPSLSDARGRAHLDRLLALGRLTDAAGLLSVAEHRALLVKWDHLTRQDPGLLPRAATAALPYVDLPRSLTAARLDPDDVPGAVRELEEWPGDGSPVPDETPRLPALLRVVEYAAAETGGIACQALQEWSGRVAARLGIHPSALGERRADAARWSNRSAGTGVRVLVELSRHPKDPADRYRCAVWRMRADGTAARTATGTERPRTGREIARLVREVAGGAEGAGQNVALVAVSVAPDALHLAVDEWDGASADEFFPAPLGEDFHLVLRCPQIRRRSRTGAGDLKRRWGARHQSEPLVADHRISDEMELIRLLKTTHYDAARVIVHGPPGSRTRLLHFCLAMGVPIVLWDRAAGEPGDAARLDGAGPYGPVDELPERVRHFRVRAYMDPEVPARPALVWEDAELPLPDELQLADPSRGPEGIARPSEGTDQAT